MSTRLYDYIITVDNASAFKNGNTFIGQSSNTYGYIANVDIQTNNIKVKVSNALQEYQIGEVAASNHFSITNSLQVDVFLSNGSSVYNLVNAAPTYNSEIGVYVDGIYQPSDRYNISSSNSLIWFSNNFSIPSSNSNITVVKQSGNVYSQSFYSSPLSLGNSYTSTSANILAIYNSSFIRSKRAFTQPPIIRLLTIYYPGEWYPPLESGNPSGGGEGYAWPVNMPWRLAQVVGDTFSDINYNVSYRGDNYLPYPIAIDDISTGSDGGINRVTVKVSNYDNVVTSFIENPFLVGNVTSNSAVGYVNGELVNGLDPATVINNVHYDQDVVDSYYGTTNSAWGYSRAVLMGETWESLKYDTRDLLGAVVEIKSTFATHLQYWPEYSLIDFMSSNVISIKNGAPYRVGDNVTTNNSSVIATITSMSEERLMTVSTPLTNASVGEGLYIVNDEYDSEAYIKDVFKITALSTLNESAAEFELTSWLQYFKLTLPKRKYYKNTCQWLYKHAECQYPGPGGLAIPGTSPTLFSNVNAIYANNQISPSAEGDKCAKSWEACSIRNNTLHFGGFPGTGRSLPQA
jgi:phage-related protein